MSGDSLIRSIASVVLSILRETDAIDYRALYPGEIVESDGNRATVLLDDHRLGTLSGCRIHRPAGWTSSPGQGTRCLVGWYAYNPSLRFCLDGFDGNGSVRETTISVDRALNLGAGSGLDKVATRGDVQNAVTAIVNAFNGHTHTGTTLVTATGIPVTGAVSTPVAPLAAQTIQGSPLVNAKAP